MRIKALKSIKPVFFSSLDVASALKISEASARLTCHRYVKKGYLIRPKRDLYLLEENWASLGNPGQYALANRLQVPSYVSFLTALSYHEISTQVQKNFVESAAVTRTKKVESVGWTFRYFKLAGKLYFGFTKKESFFIALPEKALLDALYLMSLSRYRLDWSALDIGKLNRRELKRMAIFFPERTRELARRLCKN